MENWCAKKSNMYFHLRLLNKQKRFGTQKYEEASHNCCAPCKKLTHFLERGSVAPFIVSYTSKENGTTRLVDDGRRGGQNQWAALNETL